MSTLRQTNVNSHGRWVNYIHPVLFAAYPVLFLWSQNVGETDPAEVVLPLVLTTVVVGLITVILGLLMRDVRRAALIMTPLVIGLLMYGHASRVVRPLGVPGLAQQAGWSPSLPLRLYTRCAFLVRSSSGSDCSDTCRGRAHRDHAGPHRPVPSHRPHGKRAPGPAPDPALPISTTAQKRDVYWFIFDRYGSDHALDIAYDMENDLTPCLREAELFGARQFHTRTTSRQASRCDDDADEAPRGHARRALLKRPAAPSRRT